MRMILEFAPPLQKSGVYAIKNMLTGQLYIGSAKSLKDRWKAHRSALRARTHHNRLLQRDFDRYGLEVFDWFPVAYCAPECVLAEEQSFLDHLKPTYNLCSVVVNTRQGATNTPEHTSKIRAASQKLWADPAFRAKQAEGFKTARPKSNARYLEIDGERRTWQEWAAASGVSVQLIAYRMKRGMSAKDAVFTPVEPRVKRK